jgi:hypothetical protein
MVPPKDLETNLKSQHQFLMDVILKGNKMQYPSMDPNAMVLFLYQREDLGNRSKKKFDIFTLFS